MIELFFSGRFLPLFTTQFFGAFNDNFLKCAILTLVTFKLSSDAHRAAMLTNLAMAAFTLPYFVFSSLAGQISDKFDKAHCCRIVKFAEIVLMALAFAAFLRESVGALLILLFLMGTQSTFFSPSKYSLLPQHLHRRELVAGNALIEGGTFLAILIGSIAGTVVVALRGGAFWSGAVLCALAVVGYAASRRIPPAPPTEVRVKLSPNLPAETMKIVRDAFRRPRVRLCIISLSGFWMAGSLYVSQLPGLCREVLGADQYTNAFFLTLFSVGVGLGAAAAPRLLRAKISARLAPPAALTMALFSLDLSLAAFPGREAFAGSGGGLAVLAACPAFWRVSLDLLGVSVAGGLFSVPLQALMQHASPAGMEARVIAANNIVNALFMALAALAAAAGARCLRVSPSGVFAVIAAVCAVNAACSRRLVRRGGRSRRPSGSPRKTANGEPFWKNGAGMLYSEPASRPCTDAAHGDDAGDMRRR